MHRRKGDTLVEVALAVGIFSMVAVAVVSVVSGSTSNAQSSLEITVTREEMDAQAEALRFIHSSYIAGGESNLSGNTDYVNLWRTIVGRAKNQSVSLDFTPTTCAELYEGNNLRNQGAFIINTHAMSSVNPDEVIITPEGVYGNKFTVASTYPRAVYGGTSDTLLEQDTGVTIGRIEGLYVVPFRDNASTAIVTTTVSGGTKIERKSAYYDFYIRSCWYAPGADKPSTISTVIRLFDPDVSDF